jgi:phytanoyl-CoA hydroxylase
MDVSAEQAAFFAREGFLVLPGFASAEEVAALLARGAALLAACDPEANPSVFSTKRQEKTTDEYFLASGNNVSFFLEEGALDANGRLTKPKELAVNKFGHGARPARTQRAQRPRGSQLGCSAGPAGWAVCPKMMLPRVR